MKSHSVLLLGLNSGDALSGALHNILDPHFNLLVRTHPEQIANGNSELLIAPLNQATPNLVFLVLSSIQERVKRIQEFVQSLNVPIILVTEGCGAAEMFELLKAGSADFIMPPLSAANVLPRAWKLLNQSHPKQETIGFHDGQVALKQLIGTNPGFVVQVGKLPSIAKCEANVLIVGETGTGKELYARGIHSSSPRSAKPFVPVNCGAIPIDLIENELFGHERGAFTSASNPQTGLIAAADGGTLFLDEIDCLPIMAQVKLLRFLQEKEYRPLGSSRMQQADVRIIAASNLDLQEAVGNGKVRQDLFYRLNVISLLLPPLRERREDIPLLARHFLDKYAKKFDRHPVDLAPEALNSLMVYRWPGNVRELEHVIERALVLCEGPVILSRDLAISTSDAFGATESLQQAKAKEIARFEKNYIQGLLCACKGNITKAAEAAQKNRRAFWQLIQKHQINASAFKSSRP